MADINKAIREHLLIEFTYVDLFYAFCNAKGINDPETDIETDEEYAALEKEFENKIKYNDLCDIGATIVSRGMEIIESKMAKVANR